MNRIIKQIRQFTGSEHFADGLRISLAVVLPAGSGFALGYPHAAIATGLGALLNGLTDAPGSLREKRAALAVSSVLLSAIALCTAVLLPYAFSLGLFITACSFVCSMLFVYGHKAGNTGSIVLVIMVFTIGLKPLNGPAFSACILAGSLGYLLLSLLQQRLLPYRAVRHALGDCMAELAGFLKSKIAFYDEQVPLEHCYRGVIASHINVNTKQEAVRSILLKDKRNVSRDNLTGRKLVRAAAEVIDLYEQLLAIHFDYTHIRQSLAELNVLQPLRRLMELLVIEMERTAMAIRAGKAEVHQPVMQQNPLLAHRLKQAVKIATGQQSRMLEQILLNLEVIGEKTGLIQTLLSEDFTVTDEEAHGAEVVRFVTAEHYRPAELRRQLSRQSPIFRFAARMALAGLCAYLAMLYLPLGRYSYWLLLTLVIVARPGFTITRKRNRQRLYGTLAGIAAGCGLTLLPIPFYIQLALIMVWLLGYLSFLRISYTVSVAFISLLAVTGLHTLGASSSSLLLERSYDTVLGCLLAFLASFVFPFWESRTIGRSMKAVLEANLAYLEKLKDCLAGKPVTTTEYKLARKQIFITTANLSAACLRIDSEPVKEKYNLELLYQFQVLNHQLYAAIASVFLKSGTDRETKEEDADLELVNQAAAVLSVCIAGSDPQSQAGMGLLADAHETRAGSSALKQPLSFLLGLTRELQKKQQQFLKERLTEQA